MVDHVTICGHKPLKVNSPSSKNRKEITSRASKREHTTKNKHENYVNMQDVHIEFAFQEWMHADIIK